MKIIIIAFIALLTLNISNAAKLDSDSKKNGYLGIKSGVALTSWSKTQTGFKSHEFTPPEATIIFGARKSGKRAFSDLEVQIAIIDLQTQTVNFDLDVQLQMGNENSLNLLYGLELFTPIFQGNSKFDDTQYDHFRIGAHAGLGVSNEVLDFYFTLGVKQVFTSTLAKYEAVQTEIAHDLNYIYTVGLKGKIQRVRLLGEFSLTDSRQTTIISKEFFYLVPSEKAGRITAGIGYIHDDYSLWIKMNTIINVDDQTAHYYNLPYFSEDYQLAKEALFVEYLWKY